MKDIRARNRLNVSLHLVLPAGGEPGSGAGPRPAGPAGGSVGRRGRAPVGPPVGGGVADAPLRLRSSGHLPGRLGLAGRLRGEALGLGDARRRQQGGVTNVSRTLIDDAATIKLEMEHFTSQ